MFLIGQGLDEPVSWHLGGGDPSYYNPFFLYFLPKPAAIDVDIS